MLFTVIPGAAQHGVMRCKPGISSSPRRDPVSAPRHFAPQRARDDDRFIGLLA